MIYLVLMVLCILLWVILKVYAGSRGSWMKLLSFSSLSVKGGVIILIWSCLENNPELMTVGLAVLVLGGIGVMVLAVFLERGTYS